MPARREGASPSRLDRRVVVGFQPVQVRAATGAAITGVETRPDDLSAHTLMPLAFRPAGARHHAAFRAAGV